MQATADIRRNTARRRALHRRAGAHPRDTAHTRRDTTHTARRVCRIPPVCAVGRAVGCRPRLVGRHVIAGVDSVGRRSLGRCPNQPRGVREPLSRPPSPYPHPPVDWPELTRSGLGAHRSCAASSRSRSWTRPRTPAPGDAHVRHRRTAACRQRHTPQGTARTAHPWRTPQGHRIHRRGTAHTAGTSHAPFARGAHPQGHRPYRGDTAHTARRPRAVCAVYLLACAGGRRRLLPDAAVYRRYVPSVGVGVRPKLVERHVIAGADSVGRRR